MTNLVFVEFKDEVDAFLQHVEQTELNLENFTIIALSLEVQIYLVKKSVLYKNTLEYFSNESHKKCLLKSNEIVEFLEKNVSFDNDPLKIESYRDWYVFLLRMLSNHILTHIEIISNAFSSFKPKSVVVFKQPSQILSGGNLNNNERFVFEICKILAAKNKIGVTEIMLAIVAAKSKKASKKTNKYNLVRLPKRSVLVLSCAYGIENVYSKIKKWDSSIKLVYAYEGNLDFLKKIYYTFFRQVDHFIPLDCLGTSKSYDKIYLDLEKNFLFLEKNLEIFSYRNLSFFTLIQDKIKFGIGPEIKKLADLSLSLDHLISFFSPSLSLSFSSRHITYSLGEICRNHNLEALCVSHGTVVPPNNKLEEIVNKNIGKSVILNRYPSVAVQTPWAEKFLKYYKHESKDIITGPLLFRDDIPKQKQSTNCIMYAVTLKPREAYKFYGVETHDEFIFSVSNIIKAVDKVPNTKLIIQLHPAYKRMFDAEELKLLLPKSDNFIIGLPNDFEKNLSLSSLVISFSSTVIEQATVNRIPVLLYDEWDRYKHFDAVDLDSEFEPYPVYYASSSKVLEKNLGKVINSLGSVKDEDWFNYIYPSGAKNGFYDYLKKCFEVDKDE